MATPPLFLLFDLGGTLMHARGDWNLVHRHADDALVRRLAEHGIALESRIFRERLHDYYARRDKDHQETTYHFVLRELLGVLGYREIPEAVLRSALDALYAVTQRNWELEEDALPVLASLRARGHRLGILSNAGDDQDVQQIVAGFGIRDFFDFVLTSAKCFYRKPHPRAFELALAHWNANPREAAMVGDSLEADIQGAHQLRMHTIWITRRAEFTEGQLRSVRPEFSIRALGELLPMLDRLSRSGP
jgi:HAD superfamily hydrolase (TIGR01662 family)